MSDTNSSITNNQATIIGKEIGKEIRVALKDIYDSMIYTHSIHNKLIIAIESSITKGFNIIADAIKNNK